MLLKKCVGEDNVDSIIKQLCQDEVNVMCCPKLSTIKIISPFFQPINKAKKY